MVGFDVGDIDPEKDGGLPKEGKAMFQVTEIDEHDEYINVTHEILAHEDESQVGKVTYNNFSLGGKGVKRFQLFCEATGVATRQDFIDAANNGGGGEIDIENAEGSVYFGTLKRSKNPNTGKEKCQVEWDFKHVTDPAVKEDEYPVDNIYYPAAIKDAGGDQEPEPEGDPKKEEKPKAKSKTKAKETPTTVPAGDDECPF